MFTWLNPGVLARLSMTVTDIQSAIRAQNTVNTDGSSVRLRDVAKIELGALT